MGTIKRTWVWAAVLGTAVMVVGPGTDWVLARPPGGGGGGGGHAPSGGGGGGGRSFSAPSGGGGRSFSAPSNAAHFSAPAHSSFAAPTHVGNVNHTGNIAHTGNVGATNFARTANIGTMNTTNLAAHARTIQPGQVRNGLPVHSVNHWNGGANAAARNANWNNNNWNNNWHHHHHNNFFAFGFFPWFWGWPGGFFWPWWAYDNGYGYGWNYPRYYYSDTWVTPAYTEPPQQVVQTTSANLEVLLPDPNAQLQLNGQNMTPTGTVRYFASPPLTPGNYSYRVNATWTKDGKPVTAEMKVGVQPGKVTVVDFTQPQGQPGGQPPAPPNPGS